MSDIQFEFTIQGDSDGYVTFACPYCSSEFKLNAGEFQNENEPLHELYCPYCGLSNIISNFYTDEVMENVQAIAMNYMIEKLNKTFGSMKSSLNKNGSVIKMSFKQLEKVYVKELKDKDTVETEFECVCCKHHVKVLYCSGISKIFCSYCGVDI